MKKLAILALSAVMSISALADKVGYVNVQKAVDNYSGTKVVNQSLRTAAEKFQKDVAAKAAELDKLRNSLIAKGDKVTDSEKKTYEDKYIAYQKQLADAEEKLANEQSSKTAMINNKLRAAVKALGEAEKYDFIFSDGAVLYGGEDVTDKVVKKMEALR